MSAIFSKTAKEEMEGYQKEIETTIGPSVKVEGTFSGEGNVAIEGVFIGTLKTTKDLTVGNNARVKAEIEAVNMLISGEVRGNIKAQGRIELASSAKVFGDITTEIISVAPGAILKGRCSTGKEEKVSQTPSGVEQELQEKQKRQKK